MRIVFIAVLLIITQSCSVSKPSNTNMLFDLQGHRGCRGLLPENTIPAMLKAIDLGVTTLEMDAVITKDKQVILSHEPFFSHEITTTPDGRYVTEDEEQKLNIYQMNYEEVTKFDVGLKPHPRFKKQQKIAAIKPKLADVIDSAEAYAKQKSLNPLFYNIETKSKASTDRIYHPEPDEFVDLLIAVIEDKGIEERTIIQSFDIRTLQYLHQKYPSIKTALLVEDKTRFEEHLTTLGFTPAIYSPHYLLVTTPLIRKCKQSGIQVIPWTVNTIRAMKRMKNMGVDGLITDYPNLSF